MLTFLCLKSSRPQRLSCGRLRHVNSLEGRPRSRPILYSTAEVLSPETQKLQDRKQMCSPCLAPAPLSLLQVLCTELESSKQQLAKQSAEAHSFGLDKGSTG